jgi:soluble lytic murein transglycosylase-like protein
VKTSFPGLAALLAASLLSLSAQADIYRSVDDSGTTVFTNVPSPGRKYEVVVRDPKPAPPAAPVRDSVSRSATAYTAVMRARYASHVQAAASAADVDPALIHAVISAESGYNPSARSRKGALGLMQLMPDTATRYSVRDRLDPAQNIRGGAHYLRDLLQMFGNDVPLALAAYNAGEKAVIRYGNRIPPYPETVAYVPRVMKFYKRYRSAL